MAETFRVTLRYLVDIMVVYNAIKVLVDVVEHVDYLHGGAVVAECGKSHNVTEIDGHFLKQLWFHFARLFQRTHHRPERDWKILRLIYWSKMWLKGNIAHANTALP